jgi:GGDEF domain-containing protein
MTESELFQALARTANRLSQTGGFPDDIEGALADLGATAGVDCILTEGQLRLTWHDESSEELHGAFEQALAALVALAREAQSRAVEGVLNAHAFDHELQRCASAARWRDKRLSIAVFEVEGLSLCPGIDGSHVVELVGAAARGAVRHGDVVGHLGASRFALLFPRAGTFEARAAFRRVKLTLASVEGEELSCSAAGFAELEEDDHAGLLNQALTRMNAARVRQSYTGPVHPGSPMHPLAG